MSVVEFPTVVTNGVDTTKYLNTSNEKVTLKII